MSTSLGGMVLITVHPAIPDSSVSVVPRLPRPATEHPQVEAHGLHG